MKFLIAISVFCLAIVSLMQESSLAGEKFYSYKDNKGVIYFSNVRSDPRFEPLSRYGTTATRSVSSLDGIHRTIERVSRKYSVDSRLVKAIVKAESGFDPYAVSYAGAKGLMQLMPRTAKELNVVNPFDPAESIEGGCEIFQAPFKAI